MTAPVAPPPAAPVRPGTSPAARLPAQIATWLTCTAALLLVAVAVGLEPWAVGVALALGAGVVTSILTPVGARFTTYAGGLVALAVAGLLLVAVLLGAVIGIPVAAVVIIPFASSFALGLDWRRVDRLRPLVLLSVLGVVFGAFGGAAWTYVAGGIWLLLALGTLHLLETDRRAALAHIRPLATGEPPPERQADLVTTVAIALVVATIVALLLSAPTLSNPFRDRRTTPELGEPQGGAAGGAGSGAGQRGGSGGDGSGGDGSGGVGSGRGGSAGRPGGSTRNRYLPGPDGEFLVPDRTGRGSVSPIPGPVPRNGPLTDANGTATERGPDGITRVYRRGPDGSTGIRVTDAAGRVRIYQYRPRADGTSRVTELDADGQVQRTFTYDPDGRLVNGDAKTTGRRGTSSADPDRDTPAEPAAKKRPLSLPAGRTVLLVLGAAALLAGAAWLVIYLIRRPAAPPGPPWAVALARRIGDEGKRRGRSRGADETIVAYLEALADGPVPDERLAGIARTLDTALFTATGVDLSSQERAVGDWEAVVADHPRRGRQKVAV